VCVSYVVYVVGLYPALTGVLWHGKNHLCGKPMLGPGRQNPKSGCDNDNALVTIVACARGVASVHSALTFDHEWADYHLA